MNMRWLIGLGLAAVLNVSQAGTITYTADYADGVLTVGCTGDDPHCVSLLLDGGANVYFTGFVSGATDPYFDLFPDYFENGAVEYSYSTGHPVADSSLAKPAAFPTSVVALSAGHLLGESDGSRVIARLRLAPTSAGGNEPAMVTITHDAWRNGNRDGEGLMTTNLPLVTTLPTSFTSIDEFALTQCFVLAQANSPYAMMQLMGDFNADTADLADINAINLTITSNGFTYSEAIPYLSGNKLRMNNGLFIHQDRFARLAHTVGLLMIDLRRKTFLLQAPTWPLRGLTAPFTVTFDAGDYHAVGTAQEDIINGTQLIPVQLLQSVCDNLTVKSARLIEVAGSGRDILIINGTRTNIIAPTGAEPMVITWGAQTFTIAPENWRQVGSMRMCTNVACPEGAKVTALFNESLCTFQITIQTLFLAHSGQVIFGLQEGDFQQTVTVNLGS